MFYPTLFEKQLSPFPFGNLLDTLDYQYTFMPGMEAYVEKDDLVIKLEIPGYEKGKISIASERGTLTVTAQRDDEKKDRKYLVRSRSTSRFTQSVTIPEEYDEEKAEALYEAGVLTIKLPRRDAPRGRKIDVK
jgi:HSP20 family protein